MRDSQRLVKFRRWRQLLEKSPARFKIEYTIESDAKYVCKLIHKAPVGIWVTVDTLPAWSMGKVEDVEQT